MSERTIQLNKYRTILLTFFSAVFCLFASNAIAQQTPAAEQEKPIVIMGATAHLGNGEIIENSVIAFVDGKITVVNNIAVSTGFPDFEIIEAKGLHVYPGFIAPASLIGLKEIDAVRATRDNKEVGLFNPSIRSIIAYNTDSKVTPTIRSNGILMAQVMPEGGRISGSSSVVALDGWNWEDAVYKMDNGIHVHWPRQFSSSGWWAAPGPIKKNEKYAEQVRELSTFIAQAKAYAQDEKQVTKNLKFEAMRGLFDGSKKIFLHSNAAKTIMESVLMLEQNGLTPVIVGGRDSWMITDFIKAHNLSLILRRPHSLPAMPHDDIDQPYKTPAMLEKAGIPFCFSLSGAWQQRNLHYQAGQAVAYGLEYEKAIQSLTLNTAKILGIDETVGSIEAGKDATLFICEGDVLEMKTSNVLRAFIQGKEIDLDNKQKALYRKYKAKFGLD